MTINAIPWWTESVDEIARHIDSSSKGLTIAEAAARLKRHGPNALKVDASPRALSLLLRQLSSPIVLILIAAAILSFAMHDATDGLIILFIVAASAALGFSQEFHAAVAVERLQQMVESQAEVVRDGRVIIVPVAVLANHAFLSGWGWPRKKSGARKIRTAARDMGTGG